MDRVRQRAAAEMLSGAGNGDSDTKDAGKQGTLRLGDQWTRQLKGSCPKSNDRPQI